MAEESLCTQASSVGNWKGGVAKKYDFCLSRRSGADGVGSVMSTTSGNCTFFAGLERECHAVRFSVWLAQIGRSGAGPKISTTRNQIYHRRNGAYKIRIPYKDIKVNDQHHGFNFKNKTETIFLETPNLN